MKMSYKKLWMILLERDISKARLREELKLSTGTMSKLNKNEEVALSVLMRICEYLDCDIGDICSVIRSE
jgi:DNA-binding Xre family transcriptional regulator